MSRKRSEPALRPARELADLLSRIGETVVDELLLVRALTHRSYAYENNNLPHNERQEFLGDAVLGLVVTETLFAAHPDLPEGDLAKFRAAVVNSRALAGVARTIGLGDFIFLGRGELSTGGRDKDSILADTTEAIIGTVYQCGGLLAAARVVHHLLDDAIAESAQLGAGLDWKTSLQEITARLALGSPSYVLAEEGPDHDKRFTADAVVDGRSMGQGSGRNKKAAEQLAAEQAWRRLKSQDRATSAVPDNS